MEIELYFRDENGSTREDGLKLCLEVPSEKVMGMCFFREKNPVIGVKTTLTVESFELLHFKEGDCVKYNEEVTWFVGECRASITRIKNLFANGLVGQLIRVSTGEHSVEISFENWL